MFLSITYETHPENFEKEGTLNKLSCGGPNTYYLHKSIPQNYKPDYCIMEYSNEKYLYMFCFYNFDKQSYLKDYFYKNFNNEDKIIRYDTNQIAILSNKRLKDYLYEEETLIINGIPLESTDEIDGDLTCAIIY